MIKSVKKVKEMVSQGWKLVKEWETPQGLEIPSWEEYPVYFLVKGEEQIEISPDIWWELDLL